MADAATAGADVCARLITTTTWAAAQIQRGDFPRSRRLHLESLPDDLDPANERRQQVVDAVLWGTSGR